MDTMQKHDVEEVFNVGPSKIKIVYQRFGNSALPPVRRQVMTGKVT